MTTLTALTPFTLAGENPGFGLPGGYFVTATASPAKGLNLYHVTAPTTVLDSVYYVADLGMPNLTPSIGVANGQGDAYFLFTQPGAGSQLRDLFRVTQAGGALTVANQGTWTIPTGSGIFWGSMTRLSDDGQTLALVTSINGHTGWLTIHVLDTATFTESWSFDMHAAGMDDYDIVAVTDSGQVLAVSPAGVVHLIDATGSLDTLTATTPTFIWWAAAGPSRFVYAFHVGGDADDVVHYGVIDAAGSTLAWHLTDATLATGWYADPYTTVLVSAWDGLALITGTSSSGTHAAESIYLVDTATGAVTASVPSTYADEGITWYYVLGHLWCGPGYIVTQPDIGTDWVVWQVLYGTVVHYLRQRQSPRSNPTRQRQTPSLRQRQTFT